MVRDWTHTLGRDIVAGVAAFTLLAFVGPLVRAAVPYSSGGDFVYFLVLSLWPAQPLAVMEVSIGTPLAVAIAVAANVGLFAALGILAGLVLTNSLALRFLEAAVLSAVLLAAVWWSGMDIRFVHLPALVVALLCYAAAFEWLARRTRHESAA